MSVMDRLPKLEQMVYDERRGLRDYDHSHLHPIDDVIAEGRKALADPALGAWLDAEIAAGKGSDPSIILYTSGTTGASKGVVLTGERSIKAATDTVTFDKLNENDVALAYLPLAWVGDHYLELCAGPGRGFLHGLPGKRRNRDGRPARNRSDLLFRAAAHARTSAHARDDPHGGRRLRSSASCSTTSSAWRAAMASASSTASRCRSPAGCSTGSATSWSMARSRTCSAFRACASPIPRARRSGLTCSRFYRSIGLNLKQLYGQTEAFLYVTAQPDGEIYSDTVGPACPNVDIRIADNGEVLFKSPGMFFGYFKDDAKTAEAMTPDGYVKTGDAGYLRREDRPSENHRPRQGRRQAQRRHAVPAEIHREQAEVLSQHPRGRSPMATAAISSR